jgi:tetratricopeptide (TPR) repeat protein
VSEREKLYIEAKYAEIVTGNFEAARKTYELWISIYPRDALPLMGLGVIYAFFGDYDKDLAVPQEALKLNPGAGNIHTNIVITLVQLNRLEEAEAAAQKAQALHFDLPGYDKPSTYEVIMVNDQDTEFISIPTLDNGWKHMVVNDFGRAQLFGCTP